MDLRKNYDSLPENWYHIVQKMDCSLQQSKFDFQLWGAVCVDPHALQARVMPIKKKKIHSKERKGQVMFTEVIDLKKRNIHRL